MSLRVSKTERLQPMRSWLARIISPLSRQLYLRIWLAVVLAFAVLVLLAGWVWRLTAEPTPREVVVRDASGQVIGHGQMHLSGRSERGPMGAGRPEHRGQMSGPGDEPALGAVAQPQASDDRSPQRRGPEFLVRMSDGQTLLLHLPRPERPAFRPPFDFLSLLTLAGLAVALASYPIIRTLTRRLQKLQSGVERWGKGDLAARVEVQGNDEVAFLAQRFNEAAERIERLVLANRSLLANASHELRSPLARIRMGLALLDGPEQSPDASRQASRAEVARSIDELDELIGEILLASRLERAPTDLGSTEPVDLAGLCAEECARTGAEFEAPPDAEGTGLMVSGAPRLLRRAVRNLLENARRYSPHEVTLALRRTPSNALEVQVLDRGPGVPDHLRQRIFEPFYRLPGASERDGGVGLGLSLVHSIAQGHGGSVRCEARVGGGACFILLLPTSERGDFHG